LIKRYTKDQKESFLRLARLMHGESRHKKFSLNEEKLVKLIEANYCCLSYKDGLAVGMMIGVVQPMWFSDDLAGYELVLYTDPDHRGGMSAMRMVKDFESHCKKLGCKDINVGSSVDVCTDLVNKFYSALGYKTCGFVAHKEI